MANTDNANLGPQQIFQKRDSKLFCILISKKIWSAYIWQVGRHPFYQNSPPHGALDTRDVNFFIKYTLFEFWSCTVNSKKN